MKENNSNEWISVHDMPWRYKVQNTVGWIVEFAHFSREIMIANWLVQEGFPFIMTDKYGFEIHPTHYRILKTKNNEE